MCSTFFNPSPLPSAKPPLSTVIVSARVHAHRHWRSTCESYRCFPGPHSLTAPFRPRLFWPGQSSHSLLPPSRGNCIINEETATKSTTSFSVTVTPGHFVLSPECGTGDGALTCWSQSTGERGNNIHGRGRQPTFGPPCYGLK